MNGLQQQMAKANIIGPYKHLSLSSPDEIRLLHLPPGKYDDGIRMRISHVLLKQPDKQAETRLSRSKVQKTLPPGWEVFETPEGRYLFCYDPEDDSDEDSAEDSADDDEEADEFYSEIWAREPAFDCLSYVWGSQDDPVSAFVESTTGQTIGSLKLGQNLAAALRHLRYEDKSRTLWVDVACRI
ncbi:hypothetical protein QQX98_011471 [Neonectria punicea]|uniref:Heterokaryon incompatibility domain-containing protein n=1 Tax=Neonectria punicea TaxID=979145 RepID=A0ABR1GLK1_9HYPO